MVNTAQNRIDILYGEAEHWSDRGQKILSQRCVDLARRIGMRYNIRSGSENARRFCKKCGNDLYKLPDARIRFTGGKLTMTCSGCGHIARISYRSEQIQDRKGGGGGAP